LADLSDFAGFFIRSRKTPPDGGVQAAMGFLPGISG
jgi:hypothetical protein